MLALCLMLSVTYYAKNNAGIIGWSLAIVTLATVAMGYWSRCHHDQSPLTKFRYIPLSLPTVTNDGPIPCHCNVKQFNVLMNVHNQLCITVNPELFTSI